MPLTKDLIHAAADQIAASGQKPTMQAVRTHLGGGSYAKISPALAEWRAQQQQGLSIAPVVGQPIPESLSSRGSAFMAEIWAGALALADSRLATEREALEKARIEMEAEKAESIAAADAATADLDTLKAEMERMKLQLQQQQMELDHARIEAARMAGQMTEKQSQIHALMALLEPSQTTAAPKQRKSQMAKQDAKQAGDED